MEMPNRRIDWLDCLALMTTPLCAASAMLWGAWPWALGFTFGGMLHLSFLIVMDIRYARSLRETSQ
jgi:hypothetical protein